MPLPPCALVVTWRFCWLLRQRKTCLPAMATSTTPSSATPQHSGPVSCRSGELVVRWTQAIYLSTCVRPATEGRMLGQVRDLLVVRRPLRSWETISHIYPVSARWL